MAHLDLLCHFRHNPRFCHCRCHSILDDLLSMSSSLFISGFAFHFPALMWFILLREGKWTSMKNIALSLLNLCVFLIGILVLVAVTYSNVYDIVSADPMHFDILLNLRLPLELAILIIFISQQGKKVQ